MRMVKTIMPQDVVDDPASPKEVNRRVKKLLGKLDDKIGVLGEQIRQIDAKTQVHVAEIGDGIWDHIGHLNEVVSEISLGLAQVKSDPTSEELRSMLVRLQEDVDKLRQENAGRQLSMTDEDVLALLVRVDERTEKVQTDVEKLNHVLLEGNGSPSITVQVATLNEKVGNLEQQANGYRIPRQVWMGIIVSAVIGLTGIVAQLAGHI